MSAELATADSAPSDVVGTVHLVDGELVLRIRPRDGVATTEHPIATTPRQIPARPQPTTLSHLGFMRYVGPLTTEEQIETRRITAFVERHPWLTRLKGWGPV